MAAGSQVECTDFKEKETALQYMGTQLAIWVQLSPKLHAELAGDGRMQSHSIVTFRCHKNEVGRTSNNLHGNAHACPVNVLTKVRIEKFASGAWAYICNYHHLDQEQQIEELNSAPADTTISSCHTPTHRMKQELLYNEIEKLMKLFKGLRRALEFDSGFINSQWKDAKKVDVSNEMVFLPINVFARRFLLVNSYEKQYAVRMTGTCQNS